jgi:hypothetical protein
MPTVEEVVPMFRKSLLLFTLAACLVVAGCNEDTPVSENPPEDLLPDELVIYNCYAVQAAAEAYATNNGGNYPYDTDNDWNLMRKTLVHYLPGGTRLENPYTNVARDPGEGIAVHVGQTSYLPRWERSTGRWTGYLITGWGADGEVFALSNVDRQSFSRDEQTVANCLTVREAAKSFAAENDRGYPVDTDTDRNLVGKTLIDYLPGGTRLENPYSGHLTVPLSAAHAAASGETGYTPRFARSVEGGYVVSGFYVTGFGEVLLLPTLTAYSSEEDDLLDQYAYLLLRRVQDFAAENGGVYPDDANIVMEGNRWNNPYTQEDTEPRNGLATERGQVGYVVMSRVTPNDGYVINAVGLFEEIVRLEK